MRKKMKKLNIVYEDKNLLAVNKPAGLLTINTDKNHHSLYEEASMYVKKQFPKNKVFIVNRLDKDTSGIILFAKNKTLKEQLQKNWNSIAKRYYYAIVNGKTNKQESLKNYLLEDKYFNVYESPKGKLCLTDYKLIKYNHPYSLLDVSIKTGRKNQIRVQLSLINHPIIGDKKYHSKKNPLNRLGLHNYKLEIEVPGYKKTLVFETKMPKEFQEVICKEFKKSLPKQDMQVEEMPKN